MTGPDARARLREWLLELTGRPAEEIADDTPLISSRIISSLQVTDLLLLIEELRGAPIDPASLQPGVFRDVDTICTTFFEEGS